MPLPLESWVSGNSSRAAVVRSAASRCSTLFSEAPPALALPPKWCLTRQWQGPAAGCCVPSPHPCNAMQKGTKQLQCHASDGSISNKCRNLAGALPHQDVAAPVIGSSAREASSRAGTMDRDACIRCRGRASSLAGHARAASKPASAPKGEEHTSRESGIQSLSGVAQQLIAGPWLH